MISASVAPLARFSMRDDFGFLVDAVRFCFGSTSFLAGLGLLCWLWPSWPPSAWAFGCSASAPVWFPDLNRIAVHFVSPRPGCGRHIDHSGSEKLQLKSLAIRQEGGPPPVGDGRELAGFGPFLCARQNGRSTSDLKLRDELQKNLLRPSNEIERPRAERGDGRERPFDKFRYSKLMIHRLGDNTYPEIDDAPGISASLRATAIRFPSSRDQVCSWCPSGVIENCRSYAGNPHWAIIPFGADFDRVAFRGVKIWSLWA